MKIAYLTRASAVNHSWKCILAIIIFISLSGFLYPLPDFYIPCRIKLVVSAVYPAWKKKLDSASDLLGYAAVHLQLFFRYQNVLQLNMLWTSFPLCLRLYAHFHDIKMNLTVVTSMFWGGNLWGFLSNGQVTSTIFSYLTIAVWVVSKQGQVRVGSLKTG